MTDWAKTHHVEFELAFGGPSMICDAKPKEDGSPPDCWTFFDEELGEEGEFVTEDECLIVRWAENSEDWLIGKVALSELYWDEDGIQATIQETGK